MNKIEKLIQGHERVWFYLKDEETKARFVQDANAMGCIYLNGDPLDIHNCYHIMAVHSDRRLAQALKERQAGNSPEVIAYADRAIERLKRKFYRIALRSRHNIAKTAVARELACFIWGMMTDNISASVHS